MAKRIAALFFIWLPQITHAVQIPRDLTASDQTEVVRTLGLNSSLKALSNPYPLGGYSGLEFGVSVEFIDIRDIQSLGSRTNTETTEWRYSRFTVGKGLYQDIDLFISFSPPMSQSRITDYGALLRWSFYQAQYLPINLSFLAHANQTNFNDAFLNRNVGADLLGGVNVENFSLYFGVGVVQARGTFVGKNSNGDCLTDCRVQESQTVKSRVQQARTVIGISLHFENLFLAAQVDRYRDSVYSLKTGLRF